MKPIDCRNETWKDVLGRINMEMSAIYHVVELFGPETTKRLAELSGRSLLTVRPRISDLVDLGLVEMVGAERGREGVYRAVPYELAEKRFHESRDGITQIEMRLGV